MTGPARNDGVVRRTWGLTAGFRGRIVAVAALTLLATPLALLLPLPLKLAVDSVIGEDPLPAFVAAVLPASWADGRALLVTVVVLQLGVVLAVQLQELSTYVLQTQVGEELTLRFRQQLFAHVQRLSFAYHDARGTHDTVYRIQYDAPAVQQLTVHGVVPLLNAVLTLVAMIAVIWHLHAQLALVALAVTPLLYLLSRGYKARMRPAYRRAREYESSAFGVVQEALGAVRVVTAFGREATEHDRFVARSHLGVAARVRLALAEGLLGLGLSLLTGLGTAAVLFLGARQVQAGVLSVGDLLVVMAYLGSLYGPLKEISRTVGTLQNAVSGAQRAFELLDTDPDVQERPDARPLGRTSGALRLRDVAFGYPGEDALVLDGVDLEVRPGARVGIVGRTGAGKSTLISLLMRFYDPVRGVVLLDGHDVREVRLADLRAQFALVLQEPTLFATTIEENIAYGRPGASREEVVRAAKAANAHDFVVALPEGYRTVVGERGMRLSGGERQRISLARAFLKDAPVLVLDEPTSAVDTETEAGIMAALEQLMAGRTTLMIAHRLSTLDRCDAVIRVRGGRVVLADVRSDGPAAVVLGGGTAGPPSPAHRGGG